MAGKQVVDKIQLGNNGTAANNFLLSTFNDGTMKLQRGNDGGSLTDVLTIDVNGHISCPVASVNPTDLSRRNETIGLDQTWQLLTGSRASGTNYTNTTGKPIQVAISNISTNSAATVTVGGVVIINFSTSTGGSNATASFIVPPGVVYSATMAGSYIWSELR